MATAEAGMGWARAARQEGACVPAPQARVPAVATAGADMGGPWLLPVLGAARVPGVAAARAPRVDPSTLVLLALQRWSWVSTGGSS